MYLVVLHYLCSMCPPPVPTLLLSLFAKIFMDLLINLTDFLFRLPMLLSSCTWLLSDAQLRWYPVSFLNSNNNDHLAIWRLFDNNYLRWDLIKSCFCCVTSLNWQKLGGWPHEKWYNFWCFSNNLMKSDHHMHIWIVFKHVKFHFDILTFGQDIGQNN